MITSGYYGNVDHGWEKDAGGCVKTKSCRCNTEGLYTNITMVTTWIVLLALGGPGCNIRDNGASRFYRIQVYLDELVLFNGYILFIEIY